MQDERWEQLQHYLKTKFKVESTATEDLLMQTSEGMVKQGVTEIIIVQTPLGKMKVVRENRPVVLDKKFIYSHRAGQAARTEYKFSDSEFSHKLRVYKWDPDASVGAGDDEDDWKEIDANTFTT